MNDCFYVFFVFPSIVSHKQTGKNISYLVFIQSLGYTLKNILSLPDIVSCIKLLPYSLFIFYYFPIKLLELGAGKKISSVFEMFASIFIIQYVPEVNVQMR